MTPKRYKVCFPEQEIIVDATDEAEAWFMALAELESDSIDEVE